MAWSTPTTRRVGDAPDPAVWNAQVRDNMVDVGQPGIGLYLNSVGAAVTTSASEFYSVISMSSTASVDKNTTMSTSRFVVDQGGIWSVTACVAFTATAAASLTSLRAIKIYVNGAPSAGRDTRANLQNVDTVCQVISYPVVLAAGTYFDLRAWQNSGGTVSVTAYLYAKLESRF